MLIQRVFLYVFVVCCCLCTAQGQGLNVDYPRAEWIHLITENALTEAGNARQFKQPRAGFALYHSVAGMISQPFLVYIPERYDALKPSRLVVFLHGAILARDSFMWSDPSIAREPVFSIADSLNCIVLFPFGRNDFKWSGTSAAYENVMQMIGIAEKRYHVDPKSIYLGGISMGGMATFWYINHHPDFFAGFYAFSAMPALAEGPVTFSNIQPGRPLYSMNAVDDQVFGYEKVHQIYEQHKDEAPGWHFDSVATGGHRFIYGTGGHELVSRVIGALIGTH